MIRWHRLDHQFVMHIPDRLEPGVLYISKEYGIASHSCCCGCGEEVVTPFTSTNQEMTYDGESVSLWPSVGNWKMRCWSHYVIRRGKIVAAPLWSDEQVAAERRRDRLAKEFYFGGRQQPEDPKSPPDTMPSAPEVASWSSWLRAKIPFPSRSGNRRGPSDTQRG